MKKELTLRRVLFCGFSLASVFVWGTICGLLLEHSGSLIFSAVVVGVGIAAGLIGFSMLSLDNGNEYDFEYKNQVLVVVLLVLYYVIATNIHTHHTLCNIVTFVLVPVCLSVLDFVVLIVQVRKLLATNK